MNDFDDIQQKAQDLTASVTDNSPAQPAPTIPKQNNTKDESFTYSGFGEKEEEKTKGAGGVTVVDGNQQFAVPYTGGGSYPGAVLYGAEQNQDNKIVTLKSKYTPVEPYTVQIGNMTGKVDTLNMRKAAYELAALFTPRGADMRRWYGYDMEMEPAEENFLEGFGRNLVNVLPAIAITSVGEVASWKPSLYSAYGELTNNDAMIKLGNDMLEAVRDQTENTLSKYTFDYGEMGDNSGQNKTGAVVGSLVPTMLLSLTTGLGGAATFTAVESLSNAYEARYAAYDRGISGIGGLGVALAAGGITAALGIAPRFAERPLKNLFAPSIGWARAVKEAPKEFIKQAAKKNFVVGSIDALGEAGQDLTTAMLGKGEIEGEDWNYAWRTVVFGTLIGGFAAAIKTKADKKSQEYYNQLIEDIYKQYKPFFDSAVNDPKSGITQEVVDTWFEFLRNGNTREGFVEYLYNKMAENSDKFDTMPDEFKQRLREIIKAGNGATPLANEMNTLDANIDNMLDNVEGLGDIPKEMVRQFVRGVALYEYMYRGVQPSQFKLPTIFADQRPGGDMFTTKSGEVHLTRASGLDYKPLSQNRVTVRDVDFDTHKKSGQVKNEAIVTAQHSENASFEGSRGRRITAHELFHWMEKTTGLPKVTDFMRRMTAWAENVLPGITSGKGEGTVERSEAYAYAVEYAKSLKGLLGLSGDMRKYIELFNAVSVANKAASAFEAYNKALSAEIKKNAKTIDELLASYGEDNLRDIIKQYAKTGDLGLLTQDDLKRLFEVMESVVDGQTVDKMKTAFGDKNTAQSFIDRYEAEYDKSQQEDTKRIELAKNVVKAKQQIHSNSIVKTQTELQKYIADAAIVNGEATEEKPVTEEKTTEEKPVTEEKQTEEQKQETPPYVQYTGERQPLARAKEESNWIERWLDGEKIPVDVYNKLNERWTTEAKQAIGILPASDTKYIVRQNMASNKPAGVMTAVWAPTSEELEAMGLPAATLKMLNSDQLAAVGRWRALQDADAVYSIADDIDDITGGGNDNAFIDMQTLKGEVTDDNTLEFIEEAEDIINSLQNFSGTLTHAGTTLNPNDAAYELSLIERAISLKTFDESNLKNEQVGVAVAIKKFIDGINVDLLSERYDYLSKQAKTNTIDRDGLFLPKKQDFKKDTSYPWGVWNKYGSKKRPFTTVLNYGIRDENVYEPSYWISRMGLDVDKFSSVEVLEKIVTDKGLTPVDFSGVTVNLGEKTVNLFEPKETQPAEFGSIYGHQGVNQPVNVDFNIKALNRIFNGRATKDKLVEYLLKQVKDQLNPDVLHLSLEEKFREIAALGRAKMIADRVFAERNDAMMKFSQWATLTQKGNIGKGADIDALGRETKQQNFEKLQEQEVAAGRDAYISRKDLNTNRLPAGLQIAFLYSGSWKQGVITATNIQTDDGNPYYVIRVLNDGKKGTYDLVWDAREFELLQNTPMGKYDSALFAKPFNMSKEDFDNITSEDYWDKNYKKDPEDEFDGNQYNYTAIAVDAKMRKDMISKLLSIGDGEIVKDDKSVLYSVSGDEFMNDDPFPELSDEEFENVDSDYRQRTITGEEKTNQEVYDKMVMAEEASRQPVTRYLERNVPGWGKSVVKVIKDLTESLRGRKVSPILFWTAGGSGPQAKTAMLFNDENARKFGFNMMADRAERVSEDFKKEVEKSLLEKTFKNQKELGEWQVRIGVDLNGVKAKMSDGFERTISRDEIMSLYLAELSKGGKSEDFKIPYIYGGVIEENGNTYIYNKLRATYKNFDELIGYLTEQDKQAAKTLFRFLPILRGVDMNDSSSWFGKFIPTNVFSDYTQDGGWGNRKSHNVAVFGTRLLNPDSKLVAVGLYNSAMNMAGGAGLRDYNYKQSVQFLNDMLNLSALANEDVRFSRGFRVEMDENEQAQLNEAIKASENLKQEIENKIGANNFKAYMNDINDVLSKDEGSVAKNRFAEFFQKITRTSSAMALSLKPRQIFTNLVGNYMVFGGLSSHGALWHNTVGLADAIKHSKEAWDAVTKKDGAFRHRWEQSALAEQYRRAADTKSPSVLQDVEKLAFEVGKEGTGKALAAADAFAKKVTKYSIGATNTLPDMWGIAFGRWAVIEDVKARIAAQAIADGKTMTAEQIATAAEEEVANYMFSHISSSNIMARGRWSKSMARAGLEGMVAFKNDQLQKSASLANAWTRLMNTKDPAVRKQAWREIEGIVLSDMAYVAIQAGLVRALYKTLTGDDMSDKEEEYLKQSLLRESIAQIADAFNAGALTQPLLESWFLGKESGLDFLPFPDLKKISRNMRKGNYWTSGATAVGLMGFSPAERAVQMIRALSMVFGDDERAAQIGWLMIAGRSESTAKNMLGYTTNKAGKIVPKKSNKKKD